LDTVIRCTLSFHGGLNTARVFDLGACSRNTKVYNNTFYIGPDQDRPLLIFSEWDRGNADGTRFYNNIFYVAGRVTYDWGKSTNTVFSNNAFFGSHKEIPRDPNAVTRDPCLVGPLAGRLGNLATEGFKLKAGSPCIGKGLEMGEESRLDFWGGALPPTGSARCIGAHEFGVR